MRLVMRPNRPRARYDLVRHYDWNAKLRNPATMLLTRDNFPALLTESVRRTCLEEGDFGAIAPISCFCGKVWGEVEGVCTYRGSYWQPPEYEARCPSCGRMGDCAENEDYSGFKIIRRYRRSL